MNADDVLKNACYITLEKRPDRDRKFQARFKKATGLKARRVLGFDGERLPIPEGWKTTRGAFGACLAHVAAWARALSDVAELDEDGPLCFFEDDAVFCDDFIGRLGICASLVPDDWDLFYLGGEHLIGARPRPRIVATDDATGLNVVRCFNVNRLHAYVVRVRAFKVLFPRLLNYCCHAPQRYGPSGDETCFDYELGRITEEGKLNVYAAAPFLVGQGAFGSDTFPSEKNNAKPETYFQLADDLLLPREVQ